MFVPMGNETVSIKVIIFIFQIFRVEFVVEISKSSAKSKLYGLARSILQWYHIIYLFSSLLPQGWMVPTGRAW